MNFKINYNIDDSKEFNMTGLSGEISANFYNLKELFGDPIITNCNCMDCYEFYFESDDGKYVSLSSPHDIPIKYIEIEDFLEWEIHSKYKKTSELFLRWIKSKLKGI